MLLIWGWRVRRKTIGTGTFFSPAAGKDGPYRLVEARRWFTFFWLPLIPLKRLGTFVECGTTQKLYDPAILEHPTTADLLEQLTGGARDLVAAVASAGGATTPAKRAAAIEVVGARVPGYDKDTLRADIARVTPASLSARMAFLAGALNAQGKENLLGDASRVLLADGPAGDNGCDLIERAGQELGLSPAHVHGIVETVAKARQS